KSNGVIALAKLRIKANTIEFKAAGDRRVEIGGSRSGDHVLHRLPSAKIGAAFDDVGRTDITAEGEENEPIRGANGTDADFAAGGKGFGIQASHALAGEAVHGGEIAADE